MATASNTVEGEIVLAGDLTGAATYPELIATGVIPGTYAPAARAVIDTKGRVVAIGQLTAEELVPTLDIATASTKGIFQVGSGFNVSSGAMNFDTATTSSKGVFSIAGGALTVSAGNVSFDLSAISIATGSVFGLLKSGTNITNTSGVLSVEDASTSVKGIASFNTAHFTVSSGAVSARVLKSNVANTTIFAQNGTISASSPGATFTPNFQTGPAVSDITLTANLAIDFPSTLAPAGCVVQQKVILRYDSGAPYSVTLNGTYLTNKVLPFSNDASTKIDVLYLICTDTVCYATLNEAF